MARPRHPDKDIEASVAFAEQQGWSVRMSGATPGASCTVPRRAAAAAKGRFIPRPETQSHTPAAFGERSRPAPIEDDESMSVTSREPAVATFHFTVVLKGLGDISEELTNRL